MIGHSYFGNVVKDESGDWRCSLQLGAQKVDVIFIDEEIDVEKFLDQAKIFVTNVQDNILVIKQAFAEELLEDHNDGWCNESPVNSEQFIEKIGELLGITFWGVDKAELCFGDGDLFWGHALFIDINNRGEVSNARFEG